MPWAAALAMAILYLYNMPVSAAFVWNERGYGFAAYPFSPAAALRAARRHACQGKKSAGKKKRKKENGGPGKALRTSGAAMELLPDMRLEYIRVKLRLGADDAAVTALACGALNSICGILGCRARERGTMVVMPEFRRACFEGEACAVRSVRAGDALRAAAKMAHKKRAHAPKRRFLRIYESEPGNNSAAGG